MFRFGYFASAAVVAVAVGQDACATPEIGEPVSMLQLHDFKKTKAKNNPAMAPFMVAPGMSPWNIGVCGKNGHDTHRTKHLQGHKSPTECQLACAEDPLCVAAEMPKLNGDLRNNGEGEYDDLGWCALFYNSDSVAPNNNYICAQKISRMTQFVTGVCGAPCPNGNGYCDTRRAVHLPGPAITPAECLQKCAVDPFCQGAEQPKAALQSNGKAWCALFYQTNEISSVGVAGNDNFFCALKEHATVKAVPEDAANRADRFVPVVDPSPMAAFVSGVCGRPNANGDGFTDTHHNVDDENGDEGQHLSGGPYTPEQCQQQCFDDPLCMGAEQPARVDTDGTAWCALFYLTSTVTEIGVANNANFKCSVRGGGASAPPNIWGGTYIAPAAAAPMED